METFRVLEVWNSVGVSVGDLMELLWEFVVVFSLRLKSGRVLERVWENKQL